MKWGFAKLCDVAKIVTGGTPPKSCEDYYGGDVPWVRPPELGSSVPVTETAITLTRAGAEKSRLIPKGSVMVCCIGSVGKVGIAGKEIATNQQINALIFGNQVRPKFGFYHCLSQADYFKQSAPKAVVPIINKTNFGNYTIPLPPLPEQDRIVEILDQADALRQQRRQADALSQRILPALFHEMFGDLRQNPNGWDTSDLGELTEIVSGITKGRRTNETNLREVAYLSVVNVQDGHLRMDNVKVIEASEAEIKRYQLRPDDLVLTEGGDPDKLGRGALWSGEIGECIHQNHVFRVRTASPRILPLFLSALTASEYGKAYFFSVAKKTTGIASINKRQLSAFPVVIPPIDLQQKFAKALKALNASIDTQTTSAATLATLFQTLLHRAFDGSLTAKWREGHAKEVLQEMRRQAKA
jgi:type I restriction enzyme S subunit